MKKIITLLLCLALALGTIGMFGCGDATFNGNYKEVTEEQQTEFVQAAAEKENEVLTLKNGADVSLSVKGTADGSKIDASVNLKAVMDTTDPTAVKLLAEGSVKANVDNKESGKTNADLKVYYENKYVYVDGKIDVPEVKAEANADATAGDVNIGASAGMSMFGGDEDGKLKLKLGLDLDSGLQGIFDMAGNLPVDSDSVGKITDLAQGDILANLVAEAADEDSGIKVLFDLEGKKVKAEIETADEEEGTTTKGAVYLVYDESYNLIAIKAEMKMVSAEKEEMNVTFTFKGYTGKVSVPAGLAEDKDFIDLSVMLQMMFGGDQSQPTVIAD